MSPLIPLHLREIGGVIQTTVDGRALWEFLQPSGMCSHWLRAKILQHKLVEDRDFKRVKVVREITYFRFTRMSHQVDYVLSEGAAEAIGTREVCRGPNAWV